MAAEHELSPQAQTRMHTLLPDLLQAVRARRRRRHVRRAACALLVAAVPVLAWSLAPHAGAEPSVPTAAAGGGAWVVVHDDPTVLARCEVVARARPEWLLTDDGLQAELRAAERPAGLVRTRDQVLVSAAAISRWPADSP